MSQIDETACGSRKSTQVFFLTPVVNRYITPSIIGRQQRNPATTALASKKERCYAEAFLPRHCACVYPDACCRSPHALTRRVRAARADRNRPRGKSDAG